MTTLSIPAAPTPEKQVEFEALLMQLAERAASTARGEGPLKPLTPAQKKTLGELLAAADAETKKT